MTRSEQLLAIENEITRIGKRIIYMERMADEWNYEGRLAEASAAEQREIDDLYIRGHELTEERDALLSGASIAA